MRARAGSKAGGMQQAQDRGCVGGCKLVECLRFGVEWQRSGRGQGSGSKGAEVAAKAGRQRTGRAEQATTAAVAMF